VSPRPEWAKKLNNLNRPGWAQRPTDYTGPDCEQNYTTNARIKQTQMYV